MGGEGERGGEGGMEGPQVNSEGGGRRRDLVPISLRDEQTLASFESNICTFFFFLRLGKFQRMKPKK